MPGAHHVAAPLHRLLGLDVADKVQAPGLSGGLEGKVGLLAEGVALGVLRADVQKPHPGILHVEGPDVVVADGFTGNVMLKTIEGVGSFLGRELKGMFLKSLKTKLAALLGFSTWRARAA